MDTAPSPETQSEGTPAKRERLHAKRKAEWAAKPPRWLFIGDSLLRQWQGPLPAAFESRCINLGLPGAQTAEIVERLADLRELDWSRLRAAVILAGTNDLTVDRPPDAIAQGLRSAVAIVRDRAPAAAIMLCPIPPRGPHGRYSAEAHAQVNARIRSMADELRLLSCDLSELEDPALRWDSVHLTAEGYAVLRQAIDRGFGVTPG